VSFFHRLLDLTSDPFLDQDALLSLPFRRLIPVRPPLLRPELFEPELPERPDDEPERLLPDPDDEPDLVLPEPDDEPDLLLPEPDDEPDRLLPEEELEPERPDDEFIERPAPIDEPLEPRPLVEDAERPDDPLDDLFDEPLPEVLPLPERLELLLLGIVVKFEVVLTQAALDAAARAYDCNSRFWIAVDQLMTMNIIFNFYTQQRFA
jgi:hypothetical protein